MKRISALFMTFIIMFTFTTGVFAGELVMAPYDASKTVSNEPTTDELEVIIKTVKPKIFVPEECTTFDWRYSAPTYYNTAKWYLTWTDKEYTKEVSVRCDAHGNITSYDFYDYSSDRKIKLPEFTKDELAEVAKDTLARLCPDASGSMVLDKAYAFSIYSGAFVYRFVRYENGIIVPDNTATVEVNYVTGEAISLSCNYDYDLDFEKADIISSEDAKEKLSAKQKMNLSYRLKTEYDENGKVESRNAYLVYTPETSYLSVDAKTGEVYTERNTWEIADKEFVDSENTLMGGLGSSSDSAAKEEAEYELTEQELEQLDILKSLITRQQAIDTVLKNDKLYIDKSATAVDAQLVKKSYGRLYENTDEDENYQWNLYFSAPYSEATKETGYYNPYMRATVDAKTGDLISFNANVPGYRYFVNDYRTLALPQNVYTKENSQTIFTEFAREIIPEIIENTRISNVSDSVVIGYIDPQNEKSEPLYRNASVRCVRVNEGVDFTYNSVNGSVDRVTGKVTSFSYNWYDDVEFESPENAITPDAAFGVLLDSDGFGLNYEINSNYTYNKYLTESAQGTVDIDKLYQTHTYSRLVYSGYDYLSTTVSAISGELIDYSGNPVKREKEVNYNDIAEHWAFEDINTLTDLGFVFDKSDKFFPDSFITKDEFARLMNFFNKYTNEIDKQADDMQSYITRTLAVKYIIDSAGYYKIACMPDIYITDFNDNNMLAREDVGFIAIARGMKLVQGSANSFRPYENMTRAEAVTLILNYVELEF